MIIKEKEFYRHLVRLSLPVAAGQLISFGVNMMDTLMLGRLSDDALSAASLGGQAFFIFMLFSFGMTSGGSVLIAQYFGRKNFLAIRILFSIIMKFVFVVSILFGVLCFVFPVEIMKLYSNDPVVIELGAGYVRTVALSFPFYGITSSYLTSLRAVERPGIATRVYALSFFINVFFNYVFIFGKLGFPKLGVVGAAVGTVIARAAELVITVIYIALRRDGIGFSFRDLGLSSRELMGDYMRHCLPVTGNELMWGLGYTVLSAIIGHIDSAYVAANSIVSILAQVGEMPMFGVAAAAAVIVGAETGRGENKRAQQSAVTLLLVGLGVGIACAALTLLMRDPFIALFSVSDKAKIAAREMILVLVLVSIVKPVEVMEVTGILRGGGDIRFALIADVSCMWSISVLLSYLAAFRWGLPIVWVFAFMRLDVFAKTILCTLRIFLGNWTKNLTRNKIIVDNTDME